MNFQYHNWPKHINAGEILTRYKFSSLNKYGYYVDSIKHLFLFDKILYFGYFHPFKVWQTTLTKGWIYLGFLMNASQYEIPPNLTSFKTLAKELIQTKKLEIL